MSETEQKFILIDFDGWHLGLKGAFTKTMLTFETFSEAKAVAIHWQLWIDGVIE